MGALKRATPRPAEKWRPGGHPGAAAGAAADGADVAGFATGSPDSPVPPGDCSMGLGMFGIGSAFRRFQFRCRGLADALAGSLEALASHVERHPGRSTTKSRENQSGWQTRSIAMT